MIWRWYGERQNMSSITKTMRHAFKYILLHCRCLKMRISNVLHLSLLLQNAGRSWLSTTAYLSLILTWSSFLKEVLTLYRVDFLEKAQISSTQFEKGESFERDISLTQIKNKDRIHSLWKLKRIIIIILRENDRRHVEKWKPVSESWELLYTASSPAPCGLKCDWFTTFQLF